MKLRPLPIIHTLELANWSFPTNYYRNLARQQQTPKAKSSNLISSHANECRKNEEEKNISQEVYHCLKSNTGMMEHLASISNIQTMAKSVPALQSPPEHIW